jgi:hypothetical protein
MSKATILDRLAGAMKTLGKREGKALTPRQRVAAAQRWNSLADIAKNEWRVDSDELLDAATASKDRYEMYDRQSRAQNKIDKLYEMGLISEGRTGENPFLSRIPEKYHEQDNFLYWCTKNGYEPTQENLKQFRWETYLLNSPGSVGTKYRTIDEFPDYLEPGEVLNLDYMWRY